MGVRPEDGRSSDGHRSFYQSPSERPPLRETEFLRLTRSTATDVRAILDSFALGRRTAAQAAPPALPFSFQTLLRLYWFVLWSDPTITAGGISGGILTWLKALGLVCLVCWVASWLLSGVKQRIVGTGRWFDYFRSARAVLTPVTVMIRVLESVKRLPVYSIGSVTRQHTPVRDARGLLLDLGRSRTRPDHPPPGAGDG